MHGSSYFIWVIGGRTSRIKFVSRESCRSYIESICFTYRLSTTRFIVNAFRQLLEISTFFMCRLLRNILGLTSADPSLCRRMFVFLYFHWSHLWAKPVLTMDLQFHDDPTCQDSQSPIWYFNIALQFEIYSDSSGMSLMSTHISNLMLNSSNIRILLCYCLSSDDHSISVVLIEKRIGRKPWIGQVNHSIR